MNDEPFNSERQQAERLDEWITAAQTGGPPDNDRVNELRKLVQMGRMIRADETFARQLEMQLIQRHRQRRHVKSWRWIGLSAAVMIAIFLGVFRALHTVEQPTSTNTAIPLVAWAATSTVTVEIDKTDSVMLVATATGAPLSTSTVTTTASPVALAATSTVAVEINRTESAMQSTPPPTMPQTSVDATIVPAINATAMPLFPSAQVDVLFVVDSSTGVEELENSIDDLAGQIMGLPGQPDIRFGLVMSNENSVQTVDFRHDIGMLQSALQSSETDGGGTWTGIVNEAVMGVSWRENATVKLIIGFAGTRPCSDCIATLHTAVSQNITLYIVVLGEMAEQDETGFREMAQITGGQLVELDNTLSEWIVQLITRQLVDLRSG